MDLIKFYQKFKDEQACRDFLAEQRWGGSEKAVCPHCKCKDTYKYEDGKLFKCAECKKQFTVRIGTIFEDSRIPLIKWFIAIYLFSSMKKGISSIQLGKYIEVTQKTAWFMLHRIREVMNSENSPFDGITEVDEAYFGGKEGNKHTKDKFKSEKAVVFGLVERETKQAKSFVVESANKECLLPKIGCNVKAGANVITDSYHAYNNLKNNYKHDIVKHSAGEYVRIDARTSVKIHTNTIEGYWGLVKRTINGTYHWVSKKHLQKYLIECDFRYNTKEFETESARFDCFLQNKASKLSYKKLIA